MVITNTYSLLFLGTGMTKHHSKQIQTYPNHPSDNLKTGPNGDLVFDLILPKVNVSRKGYLLKQKRDHI